MRELRAILEHIYGDPSKVNKWIRAWGKHNEAEAKAEAAALRRWSEAQWRPTLI